MNEYSKILLKKDYIWEQIRQKIDNFSKENIWQKTDDTLVTEIDFFISDLFEEIIKDEFKNLNFLSEEKSNQNTQLKFPLCILDPIDGTKGFIKRNNEWCVSIAFFHSEKIDDPKNFSWIFNPVTGFEIDSISLKNLEVVKPQLDAFISRSEIKKLHENSFKVEQKGSIAYKLALLAIGETKFHVTIRPKHIWDIAAGTHLCFQKGHRFYINNKEELNLTKYLFNGPLVWCNDEQYKNSLSLLKKFDL